MRTLAALLLCCAMAGAAHAVGASNVVASEVVASEVAPAEASAPAAGLERQMLVTFLAAKSHGRAASHYGQPARRGEAQPGRRAAEKVADEHGLRVIDGWPMPSLGLDCFVFEVGAGQSRAQALQALAADPRVESAQAMQEFHVLAGGDPLLPTQPAAASWHLQALHALATGRGVTVAQVDTGVLATHPDLRGRLAQARNFVPGQAFVAEGHGTAVAAILGARADDGVGIAGIAPEARLLALRGCWQLPSGDARCSSYSLAQALQYALVMKAQVINLSLAGPPDALLARLLDAAARQGVAVVAAVDPHLPGGGFPASHPGVVAVAAEGDDSAIPGAIRAPGQGIPAATTDGGWNLVSGSSFAAAQVSGFVAMLLQLSPRLAPSQLHALLAPDAGARVDACAVFARAGSACACDCSRGRHASARTPD